MPFYGIELKHYSKEIGNVYSEETAIKLLNEIRSDLGKLDSKYQKFSLKQIFDTVNNNNPISIMKGNIDYSINFESDIKQFEAYNKLARGCHYCEHREGFKPTYDDTAYFCGIDETPDSIKSPLSENHSPKLKQYSGIGCNNHHSREGYQTIEKILEATEKELAAAP